MLPLVSCECVCFRSRPLPTSSFGLKLTSGEPASGGSSGWPEVVDSVFVGGRVATIVAVSSRPLVVLVAVVVAVVVVVVVAGAAALAFLRAKACGWWLCVWAAIAVLIKFDAGEDEEVE